MRRYFAFVMTLVMTLNLLPMTVWATEGEGHATSYEPFVLDGIEVYTQIDGNNRGTYEDWGTHDGLTLTKAGPQGSQHDAVKVEYTPGEKKSIFLKGANSGIEITGIGGGLGDYATYSIVSDTDIYKVTLDDSARDNGNVWVDLSSGNGFEIMFEAVGNQGDNTQGQKPFSLNGIEVYTKKDDGKGNYVDWSTYDGLTITKAGPQGSQHDAVRVEYTPGQAKRLFLKVVTPNTTIARVNGALQGYTTYNLDADTGIYELVLSASASGNGNVWIDLSSGNGFDIVFESNTLGGSPACGAMGVFFFGGLNSENKQLIAGSDVRNENGKVVVSCAGNTSRTIFLAANKYDTLSVSGGTLSQENFTWMDNNAVCKVYALTVNKPANGNKVEYTVTRSWGSENPGGESVSLVFDFREIWGGSDAWGERDVFFFSGIDTEKKELLVDTDVISGDRGSIVVSCAEDESQSQTQTIYLAVGNWNSLSVSGGSLALQNFKWTFVTQDGFSFDCDVYALTVEKPAEETKVEYKITRSWTEQGGVKKEVEVPLVFDFTPPPVILSGSPACGEQGVFFFSELDFEKSMLLAGNDMWGENGCVFVDCTGAESRTIFLAVNKWDELSVSGADLSRENFTWTFTPENKNESPFACNVYALTASKPADGSKVECTVTRSWGDKNSSSESFPLVFDFDLQPGGGNPEDNRRTLEYYTARGYSKIIVTVDPAVERVVAFPEPGILENDILLLTVKSANPEDWRPLLNGEDQEFWIGYRVEAIAPPEGVTENPMVAFDDNVDIASALHVLAEKIAGNQFHSYELTGKDPVRVNSVQFAWRTPGFGDVQILPEEQYMARAWCWRYSEDGSADQTDWFAAQVVLGDGVGDVIHVPGYPVVAEDRIQLIAHEELDKVLAFDEYKDGSFKYQDGQDGVLTYTYVGADAEKTAKNAIYEAAAAEKAADVMLENNWIYYDLLKVTAPDGYTAKKVECSYEEQNRFAGDGSEVVLHFSWEGEFRNVTFTLTWCDADPNDANVLQDRVEQVTIYMPDAFNSDKYDPWMAHAVIGGIDHAAKPVDASRLSFASLDGVKGVKSHVYDEAKGVLFTTYDNDSIIDTAPILDAWFFVAAPEGAESFYAARGGDGTSNPAYNNFNAWKSEFFWEGAVKGQPVRIEDVDGMNRGPIEALLKQTYSDDIEYYYSADKWTRYLLIQWNFKDKDPMYEYLQFDTSSYHCQWKEEVKKDSEVTGEVKIPTAINDLLANGDIMLVADIHAQTTAKKFFFELEMVDEGTGNVITEFDGNSFIIILPYEFMGNDPNGNPWRYETAVKMKEAKIKHFDDDFTLKDNNGVIFGTFTPRGIEFVVDSFSPFMLELEDKEIEFSGGSSGGAAAPSTPAVPEAPKIDVNSPTVETETKVDETTGSTTVTETKQDGTVVETTTNKDGSSTTTATKTETTNNKDGSTTTTTASNTTITTASGDKVTEEKVEQKVEKKDGSATTTTNIITQKADGTTVKSETVAETKVDETGKETATSRNETTSSNGSKSTTTVDEAGKVEAEVTVSNKAVTDAAKAGEAVILPMPEVAVTTSAETAPTVEIDLPSGASEIKVEIPVSNPTAGTVIVIVNADGTEEILKDSVITENAVAAALSGDATVKVVDNSQDFADVKSNDWFSDASQFVSSREIMSGTGNGSFAPAAEASRAMIAVILHSLENDPENTYTGSFGDVGNTWYTDSVKWAAENGIMSGTGNGNFGADDSVTREQLAVTLFAYANKKGIDTKANSDLKGFNDADSTSDWAKAAMEWAVHVGLLSGKDGGRLDPTGTASRAEIAQILMAFCNKIVQ